MIQDLSNPTQLFSRFFPYALNAGQSELARRLLLFLKSEKPRCAFIMKGYAGTGKTTMVRALVKVLPLLEQKSVLMAPTGRAAKVLGHYSGMPAYTIHRSIYQKVIAADGSAQFGLNRNRNTNTLFVVDEASMIAGDSLISSNSFGNRDLLTDLIEYVYSGKNCKLLLIGDAAQLPPVGCEESPALDLAQIRSRYSLIIAEYTLTEVIRQEANSGILENATEIRKFINGADGELKLACNKEDFTIVDANDLPETLEQSYAEYGVDQVLVITRSNWMANQYNQLIRTRVRWLDNELEAGELMMVVKNNYFWVKDLPAASFIANGDILEIQKIKNYKEQYGFRFAEAAIKLLDYNTDEFDVNMLLDTITEKSASLPQERQKELFYTVAEDYPDETSTKKRNQKIFQEDPYYNALQVKFAYAVTCHKSQGGQWPVVFIDAGGMQQTPDVAFYRWLYTAITRASAKVYLLNFNPDMLNDHN
jgi:exodeoxyribonuclease-5